MKEMGGKGLTLGLLVFLLVLPIAFAAEGHLKLLAVSEKEGVYTGSIANLFLRIEPGTGRVFIETYPVTKLDTQFSTRFAKEIACQYADKDCNQYDFFYTISSDSAIVGGPSAGAAIALLTISLLEEIDIDESISITGTINSGNLIGRVGGIKAKVEVAASNNISKVLIPIGEGRIVEDNESIDIIKLGEELGVEVKEVSDLDDALYHYSGIEIKKSVDELEISPQYRGIMQKLSLALCNRSAFLEKRVAEFEIRDKGIIDREFIEIEKRALMLRENSQEAYAKNLYYSAASFCYGSNVDYEMQELKLLQLSDAEFIKIVNVTKDNVIRMDKEIDNFTLITITDLQAYIIVKERLRESSSNLKNALEYKGGNATEESLFSLAAAIERLYSAYSWSIFFNKQGREFILDNEILEKACIQKVNEAQERYQYVTLFFPGLIEEVKKEIAIALDDHKNGNFALCLFKASKAKAKIEIVLSTIGVDKDDIDQLIEQKLNAAKKTIQNQIDKDIFPIIGYSYYEYADTLKESDKYSSLLYSEYAIELGNIDLYLEEKKSEFPIKIEPQPNAIFTLLGGIVIGVIVAILLIRRKRSKPRKEYIRLRK